MLCTLSSRSFATFSCVGCFAVALALCGCGSEFKTLSSNGASAPANAVASGPQLGYAWSAQDQTLRPILGVAGGAQFGASVVPAGAYLNASASATSGIAILIGADLQVYRMVLPSGTPAQINLSAGAGAQVRFSPSGTAAVLYIPGSTIAAALTGLNSTPKVAQLAATAPILDLATSDAGSVVGVLKASGGGSLALLGASGRQIGSVNGDGGLSFVGKSEDLIVADSAANSLILIRSASTNPAASTVATANLLKVPVSVGTSLSGKWAAVANSGDSSVVRVDLTGASAAQRIPAPAQPTLVAQLAGNGMFRFNDLGATAVWVSDLTVATPSMLFIPSLPVNP